MNVVLHAFVLLTAAAYGFMIAAFTAGLFALLRKRRPEAAGSAPVVSVIIPARNEAHNIPGILEEMRKQEYPTDRLEVIISDDASDDGTPEIARRFGTMHPELPLRVVTAGFGGIEGDGKKRAIERAVVASKGDLLLLTDADTFRSEQWVASMAGRMETPGAVMVLGPVIFDGEKNLLQKIQSLEFLGLMGTTAGSAALGYPVMCNGANLAYRREAYDSAGGFRSSIRYFSGDDQFMMSHVRNRYGKAGVVFNPDPAATTGTVPEKTLVGFLNQRMRWVSKSRGYRDPAVIATGILTWLVHFMLLAGFLWGLFTPRILMYAIPLWILKILIEYPMVGRMTRFFGKKELSRYYFLAQVFQLVYVPVVGLLGLFLPFRWKGRKIR